MPPAFNLSQDQTLQLITFLRITSRILRGESLGSVKNLIIHFYWIVITLKKN